MSLLLVGGRVFFPTVLQFCSVGDAAKNAFHTNPENTVFDAKRLIGRKMDDPEVKRDQKHWCAPLPRSHSNRSLICFLQAIQDCREEREASRLG